MTVTGRLVCATAVEAEVVRVHLDAHLRLTRAEAGCLRFEVLSTGDPLVWTVDEAFTGAKALALHQARASASAWGTATRGIARELVTVGA